MERLNRQLRKLWIPQAAGDSPGWRIKDAILMAAAAGPVVRGCQRVIFGRPGGQTPDKTCELFQRPAGRPGRHAAASAPPSSSSRHSGSSGRPGVAAAAGCGPPAVECAAGGCWPMLAPLAKAALTALWARAGDPCFSFAAAASAAAAAAAAAAATVGECYRRAGLIVRCQRRIACLETVLLWGSCAFG